MAPPANWRSCAGNHGPLQWRTAISVVSTLARRSIPRCVRALHSMILHGADFGPIRLTAEGVCVQISHRAPWRYFQQLLKLLLVELGVAGGEVAAGLLARRDEMES